MTAYFPHIFFSMNSHLYALSGLQILGYEDLLQFHEVSKCYHHYSKRTRAEEMRSNF